MRDALDAEAGVPLTWRSGGCASGKDKPNREDTPAARRTRARPKSIENPSDNGRSWRLATTGEEEEKEKRREEKKREEKRREEEEER